MEISCRVYKPRRARESPFFRLVQQHLEELLRVWPTRFARQHGPLRPVVERVLRGFMRCGLVEHGFARPWCPTCRTSRGRSFCPSCEKKRQLLWAEWLQKEVLAPVPHRHVVLTMPRLLRGIFRKRRELLLDLSQCAAEAVAEQRAHPRLSAVIDCRANEGSQRTLDVKRTLSEYLFERLCSERGIPCRRIPETTTKTPDYELFAATTPIVVEVKEIEPNAEERESERVMEERGWGNVLSHTPGGRVRKKIDAASPQIKARAHGRYPSLLVVCDDGKEIGHVEPYNIRVAMYGLEQIQIAVPPPGQGSPYVIGIGYGPKQKMTPERNTSISAIASIFMTATDVIRLFAFHNQYAKLPLDSALLAPYGVRQFRLGEPIAGATADWVEILH